MAGCNEIPTTEVTEEMKCYNAGARCQKSQIKTTYKIILSQYLFIVLRTEFYVASAQDPTTSFPRLSTATILAYYLHTIDTFRSSDHFGSHPN